MRASPAEYNSALRPSLALHDAECKLVLLFPLVFPSPLRPADYKSALRPSSALHDAECKLVLLFPLVSPSPLRPADYKSALPASPMPGASRRYRAVIRWLWSLLWGGGRLGGR